MKSTRAFTLIELPKVMSRSTLLTTRKGFTLVELLVVVTIIVVLLALLVPSMNKAIYQAELVNCGARQKVAVSAVTHYALENKRSYPERGMRGMNPDSNPAVWISAMALAHPQDGFDMRPPLLPIMNISKTLQCPFTEQLELVDTPLDVGVEASYVMFWGWRYDVPSRTRARVNTETGEASTETTTASSGSAMYKMGGKFSWDGQAFNILVGDIDLRYPDSSQSSHPDRDPRKMALVVAVDEVIFTTRARVSRWLFRENRQRGLVDLNYGFDDGSVRRYNDVPHMIRGYGQRDKRMDWVPIQWDMRRPGDPAWSDAFQLPVQ